MSFSRWSLVLTNDYKTKKESLQSGINNGKFIDF